jgi:type I site-specific restriction endonuclease
LGPQDHCGRRTIEQRSIYKLRRQVIEYFDAHLFGLTATSDNRTYGFFRKNIVSEYSREKAVAGGVNVGNETYVIETMRTVWQAAHGFAPKPCRLHSTRTFRGSPGSSAQSRSFPRSLYACAV